MLMPFRGRFQDVPGMVLGDHQHMARRNRVDVHEGENVVVLINLEAGNFAAQDFAENAFVVVIRRAHAGGLLLAKGNFPVRLIAAPPPVKPKHGEFCG